MQHTAIPSDRRAAATVVFCLLGSIIPRLLINLEARAGIEPAHKGFADLSLTTWVPRLGRAALIFNSLQTTLDNPADTGGRFGAGDEI